MVSSYVVQTSKDDYSELMNASDSETNAYYSLDGQRDFEDFCEVDI